MFCRLNFVALCVSIASQGFVGLKNAGGHPGVRTKLWTVSPRTCSSCDGSYQQEEETSRDKDAPTDRREFQVRLLFFIFLIELIS